MLVSPGFPPDKVGGIENYVQMIHGELNHRGHYATVLTKLHRVRLENRTVIQIGTLPGEYKGYASWAVNAWIRAISQKHDITHFHGFPGQILSNAPFWSPKIVHVHNSLSYKWQGWRPSGFTANVGHFIDCNAFRRASLVICPTNAVKQDLIWHLSIDPKKVSVIPNCVDTNFFSRDKASNGIRETYHLKDKFVIIYFGKLKWTKGIETLCKAFRLIKNRIDCALIIGGKLSTSDPFAQSLKKTFDDVIFTGYVEDPRPYLAAADVFSINTPGFYGGETFAMSLAEAMSMGLPVVCSDNPIFREVTKGNALFPRPEDPNSLADALIRLAGDPDMAAQMGMVNMKIAKENYNVAAVVNRLEAAYSSVQN